MHHLASVVEASNMALLSPLRPARTRTADIIERIGTEIASGRIRPGERLPTEQKLMTAMGVSRTVVREALAALKADGLVVIRHGAGAYVARDSTRVPFRIDPDGLGSVGDVVKLMELRLAVEVEAAGLAAERGTSTTIRAIERALVAIDKAMRAGDAAIAEDFAFHQAIADATGNTNFREILSFLGRHVIPRQSVRLSLPAATSQDRYLEGIQAEHRQIFQAVSEHNPKMARTAMRLHLSKSLQRYRHMAAKTPGKARMQEDQGKPYNRRSAISSA
jgi:GntR family transcriptional regulator, transcriptional repressor for pyruvate dehydrogenase complex